MIPDLPPRKLLHHLGVALGVAGIVFVGWKLIVYREQIDLTSVGASGYIAILALAIAYGVSDVLLAAGWREILNHLGIGCRLGWAVRVYALSQLAKYVPGNIFHLVGRQALGAAAGISHGALAKSSVAELVVIALCGGLFAPLLLPIYWPNFGVLLGPLLFAGTVVLSLSLVKMLFGNRIARSAACYGFFLIMSGVIFVGAYLLAGGNATASQMPVIAGAYVLAWLAGLVTPGAPAGIGVREAVLLFLLAGFANPPVILLAVVMGRAVTVLGDLGFYLIGGYVDAS